MKYIFTKLVYILLFWVFFNNAKAQSKLLDIDTGLQHLTNQIVENLNANNKQKIAVLECSNLDGTITELGKFISEELITRLFMTKKFQVIERQLLNRVLSEQGLSLSGLIDPESAIAVGKILGVDAIATGTITDLNTCIKINARLISTIDGSLFAVASAKIEKDETIISLMGKFAQPVRRTTESAKTELQGSKLLMDSFDGEIIGTDWHAKRGEWLIVESMLTQNDKTVFSMITAGQMNWAGCEICLKAQKIDGESGFCIGVKLKENGDALIWNIGADGNRTSVLQTYLNLLAVAGKSVKYRNIEDTMRQISINEGVWYDIRVVLKGATIKCFLNGEEMINIMDPEIQKYKHGMFFLGTYCTRAYFDDVVICNLKQ